MKQIFKSEFQRYNKWSGLAALVMLFAYIFVARLKPFLKPESAQTSITFLVLIFGSLAFGFVQMMLHKRKNHWTYLVHRPLEPKNIFFGLAAAGIAHVALVISLPLLAMTGGLDLFSATVVDLRHYGFILFMILCSTVAYLIGTLAALNPNKGSVLLIGILPLAIITRPSSDLMQFLPALLMIGLLLYLNLRSFKPDLSVHINEPVPILAMAVPLSAVLVLVLMMSTSLFYHVPKFLMGTHPDNNPIDGTFGYLWSMEEKDRPAYALEGSDHPKADYYAKQVLLADIDWATVQQFERPRRGQMHVRDRSYALVHSGSNTIWQFSHDAMLLVGRHQRSGEPAGAVGMNGFLDNIDAASDDDRFDAVPTLVGDRFLATETAIHQLNFDERTMDIKHATAPGEWYINMPGIREHYVFVATNKSLLLFDRSEFLDEYDAAEPEYVVPHPVDPNNVQWVETYRLVDGYLMLYLGRDYFGFNDGGTDVLHARLDGTVEHIAQRRYTVPRHPEWVLDFEYWVSPLFYYVSNVPFNWVEGHELDYASATTLAERDHESQIYVLALVAHLFSLAVIALASRRIKLPKKRFLTWTVFGALGGLPAILAFFLMNPLRAEDVH